MDNYQILIVEDEDVTRFSLRNLFEAEGYQVFEAVDGEAMNIMLMQHTCSICVSGISYRSWSEWLKSIPATILLHSKHISYHISVP